MTISTTIAKIPAGTAMTTMKFDCSNDSLLAGFTVNEFAVWVEEVEAEAIMYFTDVSFIELAGKP